MESKDTPILSLDSMQSITSADIENGATYLTIMEKDLSVLKQALNNSTGSARPENLQPMRA